jgi:aspartate/methionine/tyrosine aminotransferase
MPKHFGSSLPLKVCDAEGGYFLVADVGIPDIDFCRQLAEKFGVVCTPMSVFYHTPFPEDNPCTLVRFTICKSTEHVENACAALVRAA